MSEDDYIVSCVRQYYRLLAQAASDTNNSQTHIQISICLLRRMRELFADKAAIHKALLQVITHELCTDT